MLAQVFLFDGALFDDRWISLRQIGMVHPREARLIVFVDVGLFENEPVIDALVLLAQFFGVYDYFDRAHLELGVGRYLFQGAKILLVL